MVFGDGVVRDDDNVAAKALLGGKFDSYKKAPPPPAKKGWSLLKLGRFTVKREAS